MQSHVIGNSVYSTYTPGSTYQIFKPGQDMMIRVGNFQAGSAFNAQEVYNAINPRVQRPKKQGGS